MKEESGTWSTRTDSALNSILSFLGFSYLFSWLISSVTTHGKKKYCFQNWYCITTMGKQMIILMRLKNCSVAQAFFALAFFKQGWFYSASLGPNFTISLLIFPFVLKGMKTGSWYFREKDEAWKSECCKQIWTQKSL